MGGDDRDDEQKAKQAEDNINIWKIKKLIKSLMEARGCAEHAQTAAGAARCGERLACGLRQPRQRLWCPAAAAATCADQRAGAPLHAATAPP
jgi:hypothetical protein